MTTCIILFGIVGMVLLSFLVQFLLEERKGRKR